MKDSTLGPIVRRFVEEAGNATQHFGLGRAVGQIYALAYFSRTPVNLSDMQKALGISKGSASTSVRQLEQWGAARKVWVMGDRKDYYEASDWFGKILMNALLDTASKRMRAYRTLLEELEADMRELGEGESGAFIREKVENLRAIQERAQKIWANPVVRKIIEDRGEGTGSLKIVENR